MSTLKNAPRKPFFSLHSHVISLTHIGDRMLTTKIIREVTRGPKDVKKRSNSKKAPRDPIIWKLTHMISLTNISN